MTPLSPTSSNPFIKDSSGKLYLHRYHSNGKFTTYRAFPDGTIVPRIRMSKKQRLRLKAHFQPQA